MDSRSARIPGASGSRYALGSVSSKTRWQIMSRAAAAMADFLCLLGVATIYLAKGSSAGTNALLG
jgi:hypothetical protein